MSKLLLPYEWCFFFAFDIIMVVILVNNVMIVNGVDVGIGKLELNESDLLIYDKSFKYELEIYVYYNWKEIDDLEVSESKDIDFNEYCLSEGNKQWLIWPNVCSVKRVSDDILSFYLCFFDISSNGSYLGDKKFSDTDFDSLEVRVFFDRNDVFDNKIVYEFLQSNHI